MRVAACVYPALLASAAIVFVSCGDNPSGPSPAPQLQLMGPSEIEPGEVVQYRLTLRRGDRAVEDVTDRAQWGSSNTDVLALTPTALGTGVKLGESRVNVSYEGRTVSSEVLVLPRGTYRVAGVVREFDEAVPGVTVTVRSGDASGQTYTSRNDGGYVLYGLKGLVRIGLSKPGYVTAEHEVDVVGHIQHNLSITLDGPSRKFVGRYALTIFAANCPSGFPDAATRRTYTADLTHQDLRVNVTLRDGEFFPHMDQFNETRGDRFWGWAASDGRSVWFTIGNDYYYYYSPGTYGIAERFGDGVLLINAGGSGRGTSDKLEGTLFGNLKIGGSTSPPFEPISAECSNLRFELTKQ